MNPKIRFLLLILAFAQLSAQQFLANCIFSGTSNDPNIVGSVVFTQTSPTGSVNVQISASGLTQNLGVDHGIHIHAFGDISDGAGAAAVGSHFDPRSSPHGCPPSQNRHYGDMGNWFVDANGNINQAKTLDLLSLFGSTSIIGRAVIIHNTTDDCVNVPSSGSRLAQCVIGIANTGVNGALASSATNATCVLQPISNSNVNGMVWLVQNADGTTTVSAQISGITGPHGFHIHQYGDISSPTGAAAGSHFNPFAQTHGIPPVANRHVGDMGVINYYSNSYAYYTYQNNLISLTIPINNVIGRAIIVHANTDDCSDPVGNAGSRLAQCVIGITNHGPPALPNGIPTTQDSTKCQAVDGNPFPRCGVINYYGFPSTVCVNLAFANCQIAVSVSVNNVTVFQPTPYSLGRIKEIFSSNEVCESGGPPTCEVCMRWSNVTLNSAQISGCGSAYLKCLGTNYGTYDLGCFSNTQMIPACFGGCPNSCNFNGVCSSGTCQCNPGWTGSDCSSGGRVCPNNCGGRARGTCQGNQCVCNQGFSGSDCTIWNGAGSPASGTNPVVIVVVLLFIVVAIAAGVGGYIFYKRRKAATSFQPFKEEDTQLDVELVSNEGRE